MLSRAEVDPLVTGVPGNVHDSFLTRLQAEHSYLLAYAMGCVRTLRPRNNGTSAVGAPPVIPASAIPTPAAILEAFAQAPVDYMGAEWHVVFQGRAPGVYPAW